ncbi:hypothetical protein Poly41_69750 [Novipirellula artificiosorum]|uniref:Uncharacterized protein n=1 Tax=Novipirellula artificiosorum TaxID=2528016 RepID=A0A5C6CSS3_9BACT|nr:hypothetical protein Poly41_69750 [Novipirellula artificiosorum]
MNSEVASSTEARFWIEIGSNVDDNAVHDQVLLVFEKAILVIGQFTGNHFHPRFVRIGGAACEVDAARSQLHDKEQIESAKSALVQTSTVVKSIEAITSQCAFENVSHDPVYLRSGAGSMPWALRMLPMVESQM